MPTGVSFVVVALMLPLDLLGALIVILVSTTHPVAAHATSVKQASTRHGQGGQIVTIVRAGNGS